MEKIKSSPGWFMPLLGTQSKGVSRQHINILLTLSMCSMVRGCSCYHAWSVDNQYLNSAFPPGRFTVSRAANYDRDKFYRCSTSSRTRWLSSPHMLLLVAPEVLQHLLPQIGLGMTVSMQVAPQDLTPVSENLA